MRRWSVLASDYDGTLAERGAVPAETLAAVMRFRDSGGDVVLVTGRRLEELEDVFPEADKVADRIVAENGGVLRDPNGPDSQVLAPALPADIAKVLESCGVGPFELGEVIVSAAREDELAVRRTAAALAARWPCQVVPNKDRVMLLPSGVDKGTGLLAAVASLGRTMAEVLAIGDGENDIPLLREAGMGVAVADSVPGLLRHADEVTKANGPWGVVEAIERLLTS
jgi:hydroxymethylpyrimidine pyrophosphatase-like HAD family hydrolase